MIGYNLRNHSRFVLTDAPGDQRRITISGHYVIWVDDRIHEVPGIYGFDLYEMREKLFVTGDLVYLEYPSLYYDKAVGVKYFNESSFDIYLYNLTTGEEVPICTDPGDQQFPAIWGDYVVWRSKEHEHDYIYLYNLRTGEKKRLTNDREHPSFAKIHRNWVIWVDDVNHVFYLYAYNISDGRRYVVSDNITRGTPDGVIERTVLWDDYIAWNMGGYHLFNLSTKEVITSDEKLGVFYDAWENRIVSMIGGDIYLIEFEVVNASSEDHTTKPTSTGVPYLYVFIFIVLAVLLVVVFFFYKRVSSKVAWVKRLCEFYDRVVYNRTPKEDIIYIFVLWVVGAFMFAWSATFIEYERHSPYPVLVLIMGVGVFITYFYFIYHKHFRDAVRRENLYGNKILYLEEKMDIYRKRDILSEISLVVLGVIVFHISSGSIGMVKDMDFFLIVLSDVAWVIVSVVMIGFACAGLYNLVCDVPQRVCITDKGVYPYSIPFMYYFKEKKLYFVPYEQMWSAKIRKAGEYYEVRISFKDESYLCKYETGTWLIVPSNVDIKKIFEEYGVRNWWVGDYTSGEHRE